ncbi:MAG: hypothetical protein ACRYFK_02360 [Janthinobacterium lividum]
MKAPLFIGAALLGLALSRPAQAQVVNGMPATTTGTITGTPMGTTGVPTTGAGTIVNGQPGVVPNTTPLGTTGTLGTTPMGNNASIGGGTLDGSMPAGQPSLNNSATMPRSTRRSTNTRATSPTTTTPVRP